MRDQRIKDNDGFTLIEVITTIVIVGVLASLALPRFGGAIERMRATEGVQILTALLGAQRAYEIETGAYATALADLDVEIPHADNFSVGTITVANDPNNVAEIDRTGGYTLSIDEDGEINCTAGGSITCATAGY